MADQQELQGWEEIATHLRIAVRTAQKYEREMGLPVRRLPGPKGRVFAEADELDAWKRRFGEEVEADSTSEGETIKPSQLASRPEENFALAPDPVEGIDQTSPPPSPFTSPYVSGRRKKWLRGLLMLLCAGIAGTALWTLANRTGPSSGYETSGRTLTVYDDQKRVKWRYEFVDFLNKQEDPGHPRVLFSDFNGDRTPETLFVNRRVDERGFSTPSSGAELYFFTDDGRLKWFKPFGTQFTTLGGRFYPASLYQINLLGRLRKPRADGGVIVAGGYHGGTWVYEIEMYTAEGKKVGSYLHPGWLFAMAIADINEDGSEEIVLGGVNNAFEELGYSAALVVLSSERVYGQGSTPPDDDRQAVGFPTGTEAASILLPDFAQSPDKNAFCAVHWISVGKGVVELRVLQERPDLPFANYRFDRQLKLTSVQPELNYEAKLVRDLPKPLKNSERQVFLLKRLGGLKVLRNEFDPQFVEPTTH